MIRASRIGKRLRLSSYLAVSALLAACAMDPAGRNAQPDATPELYYALGEREGIARITERFLFMVADDERIVDRFVHSDILRFHEKLTDQLCELSGGPCEYTGDDMRRTHGGHDISVADFNAVVENLLDAMEELEVPLAAQNRLIAKLAPMYHDIVAQ